MYNVLDICRFIIHYENSDGQQVTNLRLQKLLYFLQATFLINKNVECFHEDLEAWRYGPVIPVAYMEYFFFCSCSIEDYGNIDSIKSALDNNGDRNLIEAFLVSSRNLNTSELVAISHKQDPWRKAFREGNKTVISKNSMRVFFKHEFQ